MSGGVDSAVAAALLMDAGHCVTGVTFRLWDPPKATADGATGSPPDPVADAQRVADTLGINHKIVDQRERFAAEVVQPFVEAYLAGQTPSPCVYCNRQIKLHTLLELADELGAERIATGHYARVVRDEEGRAQLWRSQAGTKDQSYFLYRLLGDGLERLVLPLGDRDKPSVRAEAEARRLPVAHKPESQELCFVPDGDYVAFVEGLAPERIRRGAILDDQGQRIGEHGGIHRFTVGQRRGLGVALGRPAFVTHIDAEAQTVALGTEQDILAPGARLTDTVFADDVTFPLAATVQVRSQHQATGAELTALRPSQPSAGVEVRFAAPVRAISPGQAAVAYHGNRVLGGGRIVRALDEPAAEAASSASEPSSESPSDPD